ncbi:LCI fold-containing protein [Evansella sp. LMS18]
MHHFFFGTTWYIKGKFYKNSYIFYSWLKNDNIVYIIIYTLKQNFF